MRRLLPIRVLPVLAACVALSLLGCDGGLDFENDTFPAPSIAIGAPPVACSAVGSGTILFEIGDITVVENSPASLPQNRLTVSGTVSGLGMDDSLEVVVLPFDQDCPILASATATVTGTDFTATVEFGERVAFRAALVAHAGVLEDVDCSVDSDCLSTAAGSFSAVSAMIEVLLQ